MRRPGLGLAGGHLEQVLNYFVDSGGWITPNIVEQGDHVHMKLCFHGQSLQTSWEPRQEISIICDRNCSYADWTNEES